MNGYMLVLYIVGVAALIALPFTLKPTPAPHVRRTHRKG